MGQGDRYLRQNSIHFLAPPVNTSASGIGGEHLSAIGNGSAYGGLVRIARPAKGDIISAKLLLSAVTAVLAPTSLFFAVGSVDTDGITPLYPATSDYARHWKLISGRDAPIDYGSQANVFIDGLEFAPLIQKRGETGYCEDFWVLYIGLSAKDPTDWGLFDFKINCIFNLGLL